jgi:hypothetical protein
MITIRDDLTIIDRCDYRREFTACAVHTWAKATVNAAAQRPEAPLALNHFLDRGLRPVQLGDDRLGDCGGLYFYLLEPIDFVITDLPRLPGA